MCEPQPLFGRRHRGKMCVVAHHHHVHFIELVVAVISTVRFVVLRVTVFLRLGDLIGFIGFISFISFSGIGLTDRTALTGDAACNEHHHRNGKNRYALHPTLQCCHCCVSSPTHRRSLPRKSVWSMTRPCAQPLRSSMIYDM